MERKVLSQEVQLSIPKNPISITFTRCGECAHFAATLQLAEILVRFRFFLLEKAKLFRNPFVFMASVCIQNHQRRELFSKTFLFCRKKSELKLAPFIHLYFSNSCAPMGGARGTENHTEMKTFGSTFKSSSVCVCASARHCGALHAESFSFGFPSFVKQSQPSFEFPLETVCELDLALFFFFSCVSTRKAGEPVPFARLFQHSSNYSHWHYWLEVGFNFETIKRNNHREKLAAF